MVAIYKVSLDNNDNDDNDVDNEDNEDNDVDSILIEHFKNFLRRSVRLASLHTCVSFGIHFCLAHWLYAFKRDYWLQTKLKVTDGNGAYVKHVKVGSNM